jgi:hypothetical protein
VLIFWLEPVSMAATQNLSSTRSDDSSGFSGREQQKAFIAELTNTS